VKFYCPVHVLNLLFVLLLFFCYAGLAAPFVTALVDNAPPTSLSPPKKKVIVDLSADHRFLCGVPDLSVSDTIDNLDQHRWTYGLPERFRDQLSAEKEALLVANPGCYATGSQMGLYPFAHHGERAESSGGYGLKKGSVPTIFGVSGYSGAGTTPSDKNNEDKLNGNLMPYSLSGHIHEREIGNFCGTKVHFMPHVASHFRGISLTISVDLDRPCSNADELFVQFCEYYEHDPLIRVIRDIPEVAWNAGGHHVCVGGFTVSNCGNHAVVCVTIDNLLKGAATQALANGNLGLGLPELEGIHIPTTTDWEYDANATGAAHNQFVAQSRV
jgi:N-acetyl-gamma-glutamyl-phosphate reductase common form